MHPVRKQRLILVSLMVVLSSAAIGLVAFALRDNINLFYPPSDVVAGEAPTDRSIRLGGMVVEGSIERSATDLETTFWVTDYEASVPVRFSGILPDLFAEARALWQRARWMSRGCCWLPRCWPSTMRTICPPRSLPLLKAKRRR